MKPKQELRDKPHCIYRIPRKWGREYIGEISGRLEVRVNIINITLARAFLINKNLLYICLKKDISFSGTRQIFYRSNQMIFIENRKSSSYVM